MIYVKLEKQRKYYVAVLIHHRPFDRKFGLNKTEFELLNEGVFVNSLPEKPMVEEGFAFELRAHITTKELYYEKIAKPSNE